MNELHKIPYMHHPVAIAYTPGLVEALALTAAEADFTSASVRSHLTPAMMQAIAAATPAGMLAVEFADIGNPDCGFGKTASDMTDYSIYDSGPPQGGIPVPTEQEFAEAIQIVGGTPGWHFWG